MSLKTCSQTQKTLFSGDKRTLTVRKELNRKRRILNLLHHSRSDDVFMTVQLCDVISLYKNVTSLLVWKLSLIVNVILAPQGDERVREKGEASV